MQKENKEIMSRIVSEILCIRIIYLASGHWIANRDLCGFSALKMIC